MVTPTGVTVGFGDSLGSLIFEEVDISEDVIVKIRDGDSKNQLTRFFT
jgi:hypothetical protein